MIRRQWAIVLDVFSVILAIAGVVCALAERYELGACLCALAAVVVYVSSKVAGEAQ